MTYKQMLKNAIRRVKRNQRRVARDNERKSSGVAEAERWHASRPVNAQVALDQENRDRKEWERSGRRRFIVAHVGGFRYVPREEFIAKCRRASVAP